jgi:nucleotide-binding universal stress UspA family protein
VYKRVLLAYDGSIEGRNALREGALIALRHDSEVFLLSVVPESAGLRAAEGLHAGAAAQQQQSYSSILADGVERLKQLGFDPKAKQLTGEPAPQIGAYARHIKADLVVVAQRKQTALARWWSGSSGGLLVDNIDCSIVISRNTVSDEVFYAELEKVRSKLAADRTPPV